MAVVATATRPQHAEGQAAMPGAERDSGTLCRFVMEHIGGVPYAVDEGGRFGRPQPSADVQQAALATKRGFAHESHECYHLEKFRLEGGPFDQRRLDSCVSEYLSLRGFGVREGKTPFDVYANGTDHDVAANITIDADRRSATISLMVVAGDLRLRAPERRPKF